MPLSSPPPNSSSPQAHGKACFDPIIGIEAMGSEESFLLILETVLESLDSNLPEIRNALNAGDVSLANSHLHAIKGYVPLMCTEKVVEMVTHVEGVSKSATAEVVLPLYDTLEPILKQLLLEIQSYIDKK